MRDPSEPAAPPEAAKGDPELEWLQTVYRKGEKQLTVRAVVAGMGIGGIMCLSNLYVVLKTGWSLGVTVTACILAFGLFRAGRSVGLVRSEFTMLENNAVGSVASAAGYMTGGGNMAAIPALLLLTGVRPDPVSMMLWFAVIAGLGVFAAIPIKRQLINIEKLPFPTGIATAETITSMHGGGGDRPEHRGPGPLPVQGEKAKLLAGAALIGAISAFFRENKAKWMPANLPEHVELPLGWAGFAATKWTMSLATDVIMVGAGALMGIRTGWSLLLGSVITYGFLAPEMVLRGVIPEVKYKVMVQWTLWPGAAILISSGLLSFLFQWRSVLRGFSGFARLFRKDAAAPGSDPLAEVECPGWWFPAGFVALGPIMIYLMHRLFGIPWWAGLVAIPLSIVMGIVAARVTGETDVTPTKALGPVTQLIYGAMVPGNLAANIMGANVTGGVGLHAADLLTDLKSGYLLGAAPRQQLYAQLFGVVAGSAVVVPVFNFLIPDASMLGSEVFPAPSVQVWAGVSKALSGGLGALHPTAKMATAVGFVVGALLATLERYAPERLKPYVPAPSGLGIAMAIPGYNAIAMFVGSLIAELVRRHRPALADRAVVPVSSGLIAGASLMGIAVIMAGVLSR